LSNGFIPRRLFEWVFGHYKPMSNWNFLLYLRRRYSGVRGLGCVSEDCIRRRRQAKYGTGR
jgi:hypothetical protein